jgi:hypothetical protein
MEADDRRLQRQRDEYAAKVRQFALCDFDSSISSSASSRASTVGTTTFAPFRSREPDVGQPDVVVAQILHAATCGQMLSTSAHSSLDHSNHPLRERRRESVQDRAVRALACLFAPSCHFFQLSYARIMYMSVYMSSTNSRAIIRSRLPEDNRKTNAQISQRQR